MREEKELLLNENAFVLSNLELNVTFAATRSPYLVAQKPSFSLPVDK